jgi:hypothetical protein
MIPLSFVNLMLVKIQRLQTIASENDELLEVVTK